ncbi:hypothetical protein Pelo_13010 [Pelomyxa schiedti]|nr:hypothetical protein Pelo_13010 [Pelomyxa schiedti]
MSGILGGIGEALGVTSSSTTPSGGGGGGTGGSGTGNLEGWKREAKRNSTHGVLVTVNNSTATTFVAADRACRLMNCLEDLEQPILIMLILPPKLPADKISTRNTLQNVYCSFPGNAKPFVCYNTMFTMSSKFGIVHFWKTTFSSLTGIATGKPPQGGVHCLKLDVSGVFPGCFLYIFQVYFPPLEGLKPGEDGLIMSTPQAVLKQELCLVNDFFSDCMRNEDQFSSIGALVVGDFGFQASLLKPKKLPPEQLSSSSIITTLSNIALGFNTNDNHIHLIFPYEIQELLSTQHILPCFMGLFRSYLKLPRDRSMVLSHLIAQVIKLDVRRRLSAELSELHRIRRQQYITAGLERLNIIVRGYDTAGLIREKDSALWCSELKALIDTFYGKAALDDSERAPQFDLRTHLVLWPLLRAVQRSLGVTLTASAEVQALKSPGTELFGPDSIEDVTIPSLYLDPLDYSLFLSPLGSSASTIASSATASAIGSPIPIAIITPPSPTISASPLSTSPANPPTGYSSVTPPPSPTISSTPTASSSLSFSSSPITATTTNSISSSGTAFRSSSSPSLLSTATIPKCTKFTSAYLTTLDALNARNLTYTEPNRYSSFSSSTSSSSAALSASTFSSSFSSSSSSSSSSLSVQSHNYSVAPPVPTCHVLCLDSVHHLQDRKQLAYIEATEASPFLPERSRSCGVSLNFTITTRTQRS